VLVLAVVVGVTVDLRFTAAAAAGRAHHLSLRQTTSSSFTRIASPPETCNW
jgi:hypothetical protein